jgi:hypothetical protein
MPDLAALEAALEERQASLLTGAAASEEAGPAPQRDGPTRRYDPTLSRITGFLIDLDGTVYRPNSLIAGACTFHEWLVSTGKQFVYLSNTGAKSSEAVRRKLRTPRYYLAAEKLPPHCVCAAPCTGSTTPRRGANSRWCSASLSGCGCSPTPT